MLSFESLGVCHYVLFLKLSDIFHSQDSSLR